MVLGKPKLHVSMGDPETEGTDVKLLGITEGQKQVDEIVKRMGRGRAVILTVY